MKKLLLLLLLIPNLVMAENYKNKGFKSVEEMSLYLKHGYLTKNEYNLAKSRTPQWFLDNCMDKVEVSDDDYMSNCFGKKIIWFGIINYLGSDYANIDLMINKDVLLETSGPFPVFKIDSKSLKRSWDVKKNEVIEFHGKIDKKNFIVPNIETISHVRRGFLTAESQKRSSQEVETKQSSNKKNWKRINYKKAIISAGMSCSKVIKKKLTLESKGEKYISVRCSNSGANYMVLLPKKPTDNIRVMECALVEAITGVKCFQ